MVKHLFRVLSICLSIYFLFIFWEASISYMNFSDRIDRMGRREQGTVVLKGCCLCQCRFCRLWYWISCLFHSSDRQTTQTCHSTGFSPLLISGNSLLITILLSLGFIIFSNFPYLKVQDPDNSSQTVYESWTRSEDLPMVRTLSRSVQQV